MSCRQCIGVKKLFDDKTAKRDLNNYKKKGPAKSTKKLLEFIKKENVMNKTLLDIGGGIGAIQHELFRSGIQSSTDVDASPAFLRTAEKTSEEMGNKNKSRFHEGDFTDDAIRPDAADIVTLDRVICCYDEMEKLVEKSSSLAKNIYGVVYPREIWYVKIGHCLAKFILFMLRHEYRMYVHSPAKVHSIIEKKGFKIKYNDKTILWRIDVYVK